MYKILHVDDEILEDKLFSLNMERLYPQWQITWAGSVDEARVALAEKDYDCIVCDYQMPGANGMELLQSVRAESDDIPFIFVTGQGNEEVAAQALRSGATDYYSKGKGLAYYERLGNSIVRGVELHSQHLENEAISEELKAMQSSIQEQNATLASIFMAAPLGIGMVVDRVILQVNRRFCKMLGYAPEELIGKNARVVYPSEEEYLRAGDEKYRQISEDGVGTVKCTMQRKNGEQFEVLLSSSPRDKEDLSKGVTFTTLELPVEF